VAVKDEAGAWRLASNVGNLLLLGMISLALLAGVLARPLVAHIIAPGFSPEQQALTVNLMRWMLVSTVIFGVSGLLMGILNSFHHFLLPALAPVFYNLAIILAAWLLAPTMGIYALVVGVVIGASLHLLIQVPGLIRQKARWTPSLSVADPGVREVLRLMAPRVLGLAIVQINFIVNVFLASHLVAGSISAMNYAWLIMLLPQGIFAQSIATAAFPTFSHQAALGERKAMQHTLGGLFSLLIFLTLPSAAILILLRQPIVALLLQRGAFDAHDTQMTAYALGFFALGLVSHALVEVSARSFYALKDTKTPVIIGVSAMALNVLLSLILIKPLAIGGLALANATATTLEMAILLWMLRRKLGGWEERRVFTSLARAAGATLAMGLVIVGLMRLFPDLSLQWQAVLFGSAAVVVYLLVSALIKSPELAALPRMLRRG
jgi:putative peptidoglycan lipid II flippase